MFEVEVDKARVSFQQLSHRVRRVLLTQGLTDAATVIEAALLWFIEESREVSVGEALELMERAETDPTGERPTAVKALEDLPGRLTLTLTLTLIQGVRRFGWWRCQDG